MPCMSAAANWSYTAKATLWGLRSRDGLSGAEVFAAPVQFLCDYSTSVRSGRGQQPGDERIGGMKVYTARAGIKRGDRILIGMSTAADPLGLDTLEVKDVLRDADTFDRAADDYTVVC